MPTPGSPLEPLSSLKSLAQNLPVAEEPLHKEAETMVPPQGLRKTRAAAWKEKGKEKQVDIEKEDRESKNENVALPMAKKRRIIKPVLTKIVNVVEEVDSRSRLAAGKGKVQRSSGRLCKKHKSQDQSTKPKITILIDSPERDQYNPLQHDIPLSPSNEPQREHEEEEELQNMG